MRETAYNLLEESWICVLLPDYTVREVSLADALLHAQEYADLAGELPTQDAAMLRLLLAVLHTVFSRVDAEGNPAPLETTDDALIRWRGLWELGHFPEKPIREYLEEWRERFWLFHPERPFWQVPEAKIGTEYTAAKLNGEILESSNKYRIFASYSGAGKTRMSYAQAARWLLSANGFDDTSAKPKQKGLPSVGAGWLGKIGLILAQGKNLFETLMLNLCLLKDGETLWRQDRPCWELKEARSGERTEIAQPDNAAELLTLQSRRLLLSRDEDQVTGYALLGGDFFERENVFCEQMTGWRSTQRKKNAPPVFLPQRHDPSKQFWREFPTVFLNKPGTRQPGIVRWVARLQAERILARRSMIRFRTAAVEYGDKDFFVTDIFSDSLSFHALLLDDLSARWRNTIAEEVGRCEKLAAQISYLARDLAIAAGDTSRTTPEDVKSRFYFQIDQPFRKWIASIDPDWEGEEENRCIEQWQKEAQKIVRTLGARLVSEVGTAALVGRSISEKTGKGKKAGETKRHYSAPEAFTYFLWKVKEIYRNE